MAGLDYKRQDKSKETICDVHRDLYRAIKTHSGIDSNEREYLLSRIELAFKMGKSMNAKLRQYKHNYDIDWWEKEKKAWDWKELKGE